MPFAIGGNSRIRTNTPAENAYNTLDVSNRDISMRQLRLSTGKRINSAADDVAGYITARALQARNGSLKAALNSIGDASNVCNIMMDSLDNINDLVVKVRDAAATASSGAMGTDEKVALAKAAYRMVQQIQTVVDSTVFGGAQMLGGSFTADFVIGSDANNGLLHIAIDMTTNSTETNIESRNFNLNALAVTSFGGITGLDLREFNKISENDLGIFSTAKIHLTMASLADALQNVNKAAAYLGGISNRISSQEDLLKSQIVNYNAAISRLEDADVAQEQLHLIRSQFLQQTSLTSLAQANQNPTAFLKLLQS